MPNFSWITLATGARQLVVHEAFEMTLCFAASYISSLTPSTIVTSSPLAGAEMITFLTDPRRCFDASSAFVNLPVDSITISAPTAFQSISDGSFSENTLNESPSTVIVSPDAVISLSRLPITESYFKRCASVFVSLRSLTATKSMSLSPTPERRTLRPIRPNPLMPTLIPLCNDSPKKTSTILKRSTYRNHGETAKIDLTRTQQILETIPISKT